MVYVLNQNGQPIMPTSNHAKVRILLKTGKAKVIKRCPFTIQLQYSSTNYTQRITLGVDSGSKHIGISATTKNKVLYEAKGRRSKKREKELLSGLHDEIDALAKENGGKVFWDKPLREERRG